MGKNLFAVKLYFILYTWTCIIKAVGKHLELFCNIDFNSLSAKPMIPVLDRGSELATAYHSELHVFLISLWGFIAHGSSLFLGEELFFSILEGFHFTIKLGMLSESASDPVTLILVIVRVLYKNNMFKLMSL